MKAKILIGIGVLVVISAWAGYAMTKPGQPVQAAAVKRSSISEFVDERGKTRLPQRHLITMPYAGRIQEIVVKEDDPVKAGQVVARVDPVDLQQSVSEAEAVVQRFEESIRENDDSSVESRMRQQAVKFIESMIHTVAAAKARMTAGQKRMDYAEKNLGNIVRLRGSGAKSQDDVDRADVQYVESQIDYRQDQLVWESMKSIEAATALMPQVIDDYVGRKSLAAAVLNKQKAEAEARLAQMRRRQERGDMKSPVDGVVLSREIRNERHLDAGAILLEIGQLEQLEIEADVLSQDVVRVNVGDQVEIYGPAIGAEYGSGVQGVVHRVFPAGFTKVSSLGVEQQRVTVVIHFAKDELEKLRQRRDIGVGYRVRVRITTKQKDDALVIPRSAIFRGADGGWQVFVVDGKQARLQPISVGLVNDEEVEITDGLTENDVVVLAPESTLEEGSKVKAIVRP